MQTLRMAAAAVEPPEGCYFQRRAAVAKCRADEVLHSRWLAPTSCPECSRLSSRTMRCTRSECARWRRTCRAWWPSHTRASSGSTSHRTQSTTSGATWRGSPGASSRSVCPWRVTRSTARTQASTTAAPRAPCLGTSSTCRATMAWAKQTSRATQRAAASRFPSTRTTKRTSRSRSWPCSRCGPKAASTMARTCASCASRSFRPPTATATNSKSSGLRRPRKTSGILETRSRLASMHADIRWRPHWRPHRYPLARRTQV
mmetsp:Transcript_37375/g.110333  ORF Transcript_37375/g.110333 Transcript_37375/m.110333 type:complete len:259 (-) Transcript_37375:835-1611(-)